MPTARPSLRPAAFTASAVLCCALALPAVAPARTADVRAHAGSTVLRLSADASGQLRFTQTKLSAKPGKVTLRLKNPSPLSHGISIKGRAGRIVDTGGVSVVSVTLKKGTYTYQCAVAQHAAAGMKGRLTVR